MVDCLQQLYCHQEVGAHLSSHAPNCPNSLTEQPSRVLLSAGATLGNHAASYHLHAAVAEQHSQPWAFMQPAVQATKVHTC